MASAGFWVWIVLHSIWAVYICHYIQKKLKTDCAYIFKWAKADVDQKQKPFQRTEAHNWPMKEIYLGAIFLMPFRIFFFFVTFLFNVLLLLLICGKNMKMNDESKYRRPIVQFIVKLWCRSALFVCCGIYSLSTTKLKIKDYEKDYPDYSSKKETYPMIISNHVSWMDPFIIGAIQAPSMAAKKQLGDLPLFGVYVKALQSILIDRASGAKKAVEDINERCNLVMAGKSLAPLLIFPEGTTTNGHAVINFKKGPFVPKKPIKIYALKFYSDEFNPFMDEIGDLFLLMLSMSKIRNQVKIFEYDTYYPDHLEIDNDIEWQTYAEKTRGLMIDALKEFGVKDIPASFSDQIDYREKQGVKVTEAEKNQQRHSMAVRKKQSDENERKQMVPQDSKDVIIRVSENENELISSK